MPQQLVFASDTRLPAQLLAIVVVVLHVVAGQQAIGPHTSERGTRIGQCSKTLVHAGVDVVQLGVELPVIVEVVVELHEGVELGVLRAVPVRPQVGGTGQAQLGRPLPHRHAERVRHFAGTLVHHTRRHQTGFPHVGIHHTVDNAQVVVHHILEGSPLLASRHQPATYRAPLVQCARDITFHPVAVPASGRGRCVGLELHGGLLAHCIDGAARLTIGLGQAGGPAQHFHVIIDDHVGQRGRRTVGVRSRARYLAGHAVLLDLVDVEAAGLEAHPGRILHHVDAGGLPQGIRQPRDALVLHLLLRHHAHRLWRLARRQLQPSRRAHQRRGVGVALFGLVGLHATDHDHFSQLCLGLLSLGHRGPSQQGKQHAGTDEGTRAHEARRQRCHGENALTEENDHMFRTALTVTITILRSILNFAYPDAPEDTSAPLPVARKRPSPRRAPGLSATSAPLPAPLQQPSCTRLPSPLPLSGPLQSYPIIAGSHSDSAGT